jgi:hypothetical protein
MKGDVVMIHPFGDKAAPMVEAILTGETTQMATCGLDYAVADCPSLGYRILIDPATLTIRGRL